MNKSCDSGWGFRPAIQALRHCGEAAFAETSRSAGNGGPRSRLLYCFIAFLRRRVRRPYRCLRPLSSWRSSFIPFAAAFPQRLNLSRDPDSWHRCSKASCTWCTR